MFWEFFVMFLMMILWITSLLSAPFVLYKFEKWADKIIVKRLKSK